MYHNKNKKRFHKKRRKIEDPPGLAVTVYDNNIEFALKRFKRKVKNSGMLLELRERMHYEKPSKIRREKKNLAKLRNKYAQEKEKN